MSSNLNSLNEILNDIGNELSKQISLEKNTANKIDVQKLSKQSYMLNEIVLTSNISEEHKKMLQKFSLTLKEGLNAKSLRYEKQDLERVLANLNN